MPVERAILCDDTGVLHPLPQVCFCPGKNVVSGRDVDANAVSFESDIALPVFQPCALPSGEADRNYAG